MNSEPRLRQRMSRVEARNRRISYKNIFKVIFKSMLFVATAVSLCLLIQVLLKSIVKGSNTTIPMLYLSLFLFIATIIIIWIFKSYRSFSHPLWVLVLGVCTTTIGFTLSTSLQEYLDDIEDKQKLNDAIMLSLNIYQNERRTIQFLESQLEYGLFTKEPNKEENYLENVKKIRLNTNNLDKVDAIFKDDSSNLTNLSSDFISDFLYGTSIKDLYKSLNLNSNNKDELITSYLWLMYIEEEFSYKIEQLEIETYGDIPSRVRSEPIVREEKKEKQEIQNKYNVRYEEALKRIKQYYPNYDDAQIRIQKTLIDLDHTLTMPELEVSSLSKVKRLNEQQENKYLLKLELEMEKLFR